MSDYIISCCSTADLTQEHFDRRQISYICFHYELDGKDYMDDLGKTMSFEKFYEAMENGADTKTSQVNVEEYVEYFEGFLKQGKDVLHVCLSSGISGTFNSASVARDMVSEKYPERKMIVVDSLAASSGFGLLMDKVADLRDQGMSIEEVSDWIIANRLRMRHWVFCTDLTYLVRGGRLSKTSGFVGNILNICPMIDVNYEGKLAPRYKIRTKKKVIAAMLERMKEHVEEGAEYADKCYISNSACYEDARAVADLIEEAFPKLDGKVQIYDIGTTIGSHTGPGTVALFFWGKERTENE